MNEQPSAPHARQTKRARRWLRLAERGDEQSFEFTLAVVPFCMMIVMIGFATVFRASMMPAWAAASECARAGVASEDESTGRAQAERAARDSLTGNHIRASSGGIVISGDWTPRSTVTCRVSYDIDVSGMPGIGDMLGGRVPIVAEVALHVEPYKSSWQ